MERLDKIIPLLRRNDPIINSLNLSGISLLDNSFDQLIESMKRNTFLTKIVLVKNKLSGASVRRVFDLLKINPKLNYLDVTENNVGDDEIIYLSQILSKLPANREPIMLVLRKNSFHAKGAKALANALANNAPIHWLDLRYNQEILDEGVESLAFSLSTNTNLTGLDIIQCGCSERGASALSDSLLDNKTLTTLLLQDKLDFKPIYALGQFLSNPVACLQALYLWHCGLNAKLLEILCNALQNNRTLNTLALSYNHLDDSSAIYLGDMILRNTALVKLHLGSNSFTSVLAGCLGVALAKNSTLKFLDLSRNSLDYPGAWLLAVSLRDNHSLTYLDLRFNSIDSQGGEMICELIEKNDSLQTIKLSGNPLGDLSVSKLAEKLVNNKNLKEIELKEVGMTSIGFKAICQALKHNSVLEKLNVNENKLNVDSMKVFGELLHENSSLISVELCKCDITDDCCPFIEDGISNNSTLKIIQLSKNFISETGILRIADALSGNYSLLEVDWQNQSIQKETNENDFDVNHCEEISSTISDFLERNNYYQHNLLMKDMSRLVTDPAFL